MFSYDYPWSSDSMPEGNQERDSFTTLPTQFDYFDSMQFQDIMCDFCGGGHYSTDRQQSYPFAQPAGFGNIQFLGDFCSHQQVDPYSSTCNLDWNPEFSQPQHLYLYQHQNYVPHETQFHPQKEMKSNLEELMEKFISRTSAILDNQDARITNLAIQMGYLVDLISQEFQEETEEYPEKFDGEENLERCEVVEEDTKYYDQEQLSSSDGELSKQCPPQKLILNMHDEEESLIVSTSPFELEMEEDDETPFILQTPQLIERTLVNVQNDELGIQVQDQEVKFNVFVDMILPTRRLIIIKWSLG